MVLDVGTRMFSGRELQAAIDAGVGQDPASPTFTGTATFADIASTNIVNTSAITTASVVASGDVGTATMTASGAITCTTVGCTAITCTTVAGTTISGTSITASTYVRESVGNALTAVGTNVATGLQLAKQINNVGTAASGTGVILPLVSAAGVGGIVIVNNAGANAIQVYGAGSDTIDGVAAGTGVPLTNAKRAMFIPVAAATWISAQLGVVSA